MDVIDIEQADADEKEWAFTEWVKSGQSTTETAEITGISPRTIRDWVTRYGWKRRYAEVIDGVTAESIAAMRLFAGIGMRTGIRRLLTDMDNPDLSPRDVRDHLTLLARLTGGMETQAEQAAPMIDARQVHISPGSLTTEEARALSVKAIEENVDRSKVRKEGRRGYQ